MTFHPLQKIEEAKETGLLPEDTYKLILERFYIVEEGIKRIETATRIKYPIYYIDPKIILAYDKSNYINSYGIYFARTLPVVSESFGLNIVIQVSGALVAYGLRGTIHAILSHEFLHYIDILNKIRKMEIVSDELSYNLYDGIYKDQEKIIEPSIVFKSDKTLIRHIKKRFSEGFSDRRLENKVIEKWIDQRLPTIKDELANNFIRIPIDKISNFKLDESIDNKIQEYEKDIIKYEKKAYSSYKKQRR